MTLWIITHPFLTLGLYLLMEAFLPVWAQPTAWVLRGSIRLYQMTLSGNIPVRCKFHPTCSRYGLACIQKYGTLRGSLLTTWRLIRCSPLTSGGEDPVP